MEKILINKISHNIATFITGSFIGYLAWNVSTKWMVFASLLFFVYLLFPRRSTLALFLLGYYLVAGRGLITSISYYYHSWSLALFFWFLIPFILTLVYTLIWSKYFWKRVALFPLIIIVLTLPPIGVISAVNPLSAAGIVFPGYKFLGILFYLLSIIIIAVFIHSIPFKKMGWLILFMLLLLQANTWEAPRDHLKKFQTTTNKIFYSPKRIKQNRKEEISKILVNQANKFNAQKILFYESALGMFIERKDIDLWNTLEKNKSVYFGVLMYDSNKMMYENSLMKIQNRDYSVIYRQRIPMPISMWKPFSNKGAKLNLFKNPITQDENDKLGVFICYEQVLVFPYLQTMWYKPTALIGVSNLWWDKGNTFFHMQQITIQAWGSLMNIPIYYSYNN